MVQSTNLIDDMKGFLDALEARSSTLCRRVHRWNPGRGVRGEMAGAPEEPYRMFGPDINSGVARKALTGGDRELTSELGKMGGGGWVKILIEQKVISGKDQAHIDWVRARMVQNTDARVARDYADAGRRRYHSAVAAGDGADPGYRTIAQSVNLAHRSDHDSQLDSGRTDCGGRRSRP